MNLENLKQMINLLESLNTNEKNKEIETKDREIETDLIGKYVILRGYDSGVHFGKLLYASKNIYKLENSRRMYRFWTKKGVGLTDVATYGLSESNESTICTTIPYIEITDNRICEIIPCTDEVVEQIKNYKNARMED